MIIDIFLYWVYFVIIDMVHAFVYKLFMGKENIYLLCIHSHEVNLLVG
jgi:hypothetical protein